jgi:tRNA pseudouridine38-40 synthase
VQNHLIILSYDGTDFHGWQRQPEARTVQETVEEAIGRLSGSAVKLIGAGRTDAGVHARGQAASFKAALRLPDKEMFKALNALLPADVRVGEIRRVPAFFHALRDARAKVYKYRICLAPQISPFDIRYALHWPYPLNVRRMRLAARMFVREADFSGFSSNRERHPVRRVVSSEIVRRGDELIYTIEAKGFLRYMVRGIVGTLLEVGRGRLEPGVIDGLFERKARTLASPTAPARGLCLERVIY